LLLGWQVLALGCMPLQRRRLTRCGDIKTVGVMSLEYGLVAAFAIISIGGVGLAGFLIWLLKREGDGHGAAGVKRA